MSEKKERTPKQIERRKLILGEIRFYLCVIIGALLFIKFIACFSIVDGSSMYPSFEDKDRLLVQKVSYYFHDPERFDVIVFEPTQYKGEHFIKRVIGLPGETVQVINGYFYINGEKLESDIYGYDLMDYSGRASEPITLKEGEFFVAGDNRNHSNDSRSVAVGNVTKDQILGKVLVRFWPFSTARFF